MRRQPNTLDCHRLILWAQSIGKAAEMKQRLMDLYFTEGADLSDREVLVQAAADVGMDADKTREMLASDADVERVESAANSAKDAGIDGVPTFILGGVAAVTGAQSPEVLANAIEQIAVNREQFLAEQRKAATPGLARQPQRQHQDGAGRDPRAEDAHADALPAAASRAPSIGDDPEQRRSRRRRCRPASGWPRGAKAPPAAS